jgi:hypothetical protein
MQLRDRIISDLDDIERTENVLILLAVESGSRAWGFPSSDSDFDVRFVYVHRPEWYLSIDVEDRRDVIERPLRDVIDVSGWDIRKALRLFQKSNPPLLEWLQCPIVYRERSTFAQRLREFLPTFHSPKASFFHYLHMAQGNMREFLRGETVWRKKYLYVLRPLLAMHWIERGLGPVPIEFGKLVDTTVPAGELRLALDELVAAKKAGVELGMGPQIPSISRFIEAELTRLERISVEQPAVAPRIEELNELFRATLLEVWGRISSQI